jgi:hypothetical protein
MKPMALQMLYLVLDCYPKVGSDAFERFAGATVGCWVRADVCPAGLSADAFAREKLSHQGWSVVSTLVSEEVSSVTYADKIEGREHFEQAQLDGFVAHFYVRPRESIGEGGCRESSLAGALGSAGHEISHNGGVSLFSAQDRQWANGVTPDGDEFLPLWVTTDDAVGWLEFWPGYEPRAVTPEDLRSSGLLERVDAAGMWIALGVGRSLLTTCHSGWIMELVRT